MSDIIDRLRNKLHVVTETEQIGAADIIESLSSELASWKADAIRLLGEKVKAEKERDLALEALRASRDELVSLNKAIGWRDGEWPSVTAADKAIIELEGE